MQKYSFIFLIFLICFQCTQNSNGPQSEEAKGLPLYSGDELRNIFYPLGGIGTGNILMGGRGNILEFEIFNRAHKDELPPYMTFFSLWYRAQGEEAGAMVLERQFLNDFDNGFGQPRQQLSGLPRFREAHWSGAPPVVGIDFEDPRVPLEIRLECFNPLIPLDVNASSLPLGEFTWIVSNQGSGPIDFSMALNISNPFKNLNYRNSKPAHTTRNSLYKKDHITGIYFENLVDPDHPDFGNMVVATDHRNETVQTGIIAERWWDDAHVLWGDFSDDGRITEQLTPVQNEGWGESVSTILVDGHLEAGEVDTIHYYITWYVPNRVLENVQAFGEDGLMGHQTQNYYTNSFSDAGGVLGQYLASREEWKQKSELFLERVTSSTLPNSVKDAALSNLAILKSNLLSRMENGDVHGYEGLGPDFGCCPGNCTHVWNYAQTMASLFPSLERNVRETAFLTQTFESGYQCFRTTFPIGRHHFRSIAADGHMGNIMRVYREWKFSGDSAWLTSIWPSVRSCMEYAWYGPQPTSKEGEWTRDFTPWDPEMKGVLSGKQHNTYDIDFYGPNMLTGGLYLGALKACAEMADFMGDPGASKYSKVYESGKLAYDSLLWNGSWYVQHVEAGHDKYQYGEGCLSDQLLGQYLAFNSGLGPILDPGKLKKCLSSIYANNFIPDFSDFHNVQRVYALNDEGGLVLCSWPGGNREPIPFPYADEVWTGVEYQVAASLIRVGLVSEGLDIVEAVRKRYAGFNRNPYAEIESGFYYARALASWAVLEALSGYGYDGMSHTMRFDPALDGDQFQSFWSCGTGWGSFRRQGSETTIGVDFGTLGIKELILGNEKGRVLKSVQAGERSLDFSWDKNTGRCHLKAPVHLKSSEKLILYLD